jgi:hypothetical protein
VADVMGRIAVSRNSGRDMKIRGIELLLDGEFVGNLAFGQTYEAEIAPGTHTLTATNRMYSPSIDFEVKAGDTVRFVVTSIPLGGLWLLIAMMGTVAYRVKLERVA